MQLIVITEYDSVVDESLVIGVADSPENAINIIDEFYGNDLLSTTIHMRDLDDPSIYQVKTVEVKTFDDEIRKYLLTLEWFTLNKA